MRLANSAASVTATRATNISVHGNLAKEIFGERIFGTKYLTTSILTMLVVSVSAAPALAQARSGQYGGGFLEYLMTGSTIPGARSGIPRAEAARPRYAAAYGHGGPAEPQASPAYGDPMQGYGQPQAMPARTRMAALPMQAGADTAIGRAIDPRYDRQVVAYGGGQRPGTIVIDTSARHLYLVQGGGQAIRYGIGVGRPGFLWTGVKAISQKREWPDWTPPAEMLVRRPDLPRHMEGGPENPLGARAMYLGSSLYRIHGTNEPHTIGQAVSSGCIRMMNEDVIDLYERTPVGTRVEVI